MQCLTNTTQMNMARRGLDLSELEFNINITCARVFADTYMHICALRLGGRRLTATAIYLCHTGCILNY